MTHREIFSARLQWMFITTQRYPSREYISTLLQNCSRPMHEESGCAIKCLNVKDKFAREFSALTAQVIEPSKSRIGFNITTKRASVPLACSWRGVMNDFIKNNHFGHRGGSKSTTIRRTNDSYTANVSLFASKCNKVRWSKAKFEYFVRLLWALEL